MGSEETCRSYSYNSQGSLCVWSIETIRYRLGWEFWTKVHALDAFGKLRHYGKYQEPGYAKYKQVSVKNCQKHCNKDKKCKAFSYQPKKMRCYLADSGIHYDPNFVYFERRGMKPRKNIMDMEDQQEALQVQELAAKKAKRVRLVASIQEREDKNQRTAHEMKQKGNYRESEMKLGQKKHAEKRLAREKTLESHDKRLAAMNTVYNEGYFKAKGVTAEKKTKEKDIKGMRAKELEEKDARKETMHKQKHKKVREEKKFKVERHHAQSRLLVAKEKVTKLKNSDMELEIDKEERILDVAKNLALEKKDVHANEVENEKQKKFNTLMRKKKNIGELRHKVSIAKAAHKQEKVLLNHYQQMTEDKQYDSHIAMKMPNITKTTTPMQ